VNETTVTIEIETDRKQQIRKYLSEAGFQLFAADFMV